LFIRSGDPTSLHAFVLLADKSDSTTTASLALDPIDVVLDEEAMVNLQEAFGEPAGFFVYEVDKQIPLFKGETPDEVSCNGQLALVDCQDPSANWLFSGAQLFSAECWIQGHSAAMTVNEDCTSLELNLTVNGVPEPITRSQSFMFLEPSFIETIVDVAPVEDEDSGSGGLGGMYSDRRLKQNIHLVDKSPSDIPIYTFNYRSGIKLANNEVLDNKSTFVGVMAQDLLELAPHAVTMNEEDGFYRVDYSKIDVDFGKL
jgi:hypothetical protein